jgi:SOS-response transcriptional repressor LexA
MNVQVASIVDAMNDEALFQPWFPGGRIRCTPRNPHYRPFEVTLGKDAKIIGRVVQKVTRHL